MVRAKRPDLCLVARSALASSAGRSATVRAALQIRQRETAMRDQQPIGKEQRARRVRRQS